MIKHHLPLASVFRIEPRDYEHFRIDAAAADTIGTLVVALCIGILVAALYNFYVRHVPGAVVRALLRAEALSPEAAKTAEELGLASNPFFRLELLHGSALSHLVRYVGDEPDEQGNRAQKTAGTRYYIPEEAKYRAEIRFAKQGNGVMGLVLTALLTVGIAALVIRLLPWFLGVIDKIL